MYLQSIKSVKHNAAKSVNRSILKKSRHIGFGVFIVHSSMGVGIRFSVTHYTQRVTKRCRLSVLTNSALVYEPKCGGAGGGEGGRGPSQWEQLCTWSLYTKLWRSNSTYKLCSKPHPYMYEYNLIVQTYVYRNHQAHPRSPRTETLPIMNIDTHTYIVFIYCIKYSYMVKGTIHDPFMYCSTNKPVQLFRKY